MEVKTEAPGKEIQGDPQWRVLIPSCSGITCRKGSDQARPWLEGSERSLDPRWLLSSLLCSLWGKSSFPLSILIPLCGLIFYFGRPQPGSGAVLAASFLTIFSFSINKLTYQIICPLSFRQPFKSRLLSLPGLAAERRFFPLPQPYLSKHESHVKSSASPLTLPSNPPRHLAPEGNQLNQRVFYLCICKHSCLP